MEAVWNPWHGCTKISPGCLHCYVYRIDASHRQEISSSECRKTSNYSLPVRRDRTGAYRISPGTYVYTCFTSDFFLEDADAWRDEAWRMIRERSDCTFFFFTKRIDRFLFCIPADWGDGYENVVIGCTVENNRMAQKRLPLFLEAPIRRRVIGVEPILESVDLLPYLDGRISEVSVGGESGPDARTCDYDWVLDIRRQCAAAGTAFHFHQTGACFRKDGRIYRIPRNQQGIQARKAGIDLDSRN